MRFRDSYHSCLALIVASGCYSEPETKYGNPGGLDREKLPAAGVPTTAPSGTPSAPFSDSGVAGCNPELGPTASTCTVSFQQTIYRKIQAPVAQAGWNCASSGCHGGASPPLLKGDASTVWKAMAAYTGDLGKRYIAPCDTNPDSSSFMCNVSLQGTCGTLMPLGAALSDAERSEIRTWLSCGAPLN